MKTSLIIPTLNRVYDLTRCLKSINKLTQAFDEIIIVEQGNMDATQLLIEDFKTLSIHLYYHSVQSAAQARNVGIEKAQGELLFFIDDDTELNENYVKVAVDYFASNPEVVGITARVDNKQITMVAFIKRLIMTLLGQSSFNNKTLLSGNSQYGFFLNKAHKAQVLKGGASALRSLVFEQGFRFNKDFIRWSSGEDTMFSYQLYKYYGDGSLMYVPEFKLTHYDSEDVSINNESAIRMYVIYRFIFWHKEMYQQSTFNVIGYLWGQFGIIIYQVFAYNSYCSKRNTFKYLLKSYYYLLKNWRDIVNNKADYNQFILQTDTE